MTDQNQNLWMLIRPGGPAGLTWGVVAQTGQVIASQIDLVEHARLLITTGNIEQGDFDTVREVARELREILDRDLQNPTQGSEDYMVRSVGEAIIRVSRKPR